MTITNKWTDEDLERLAAIKRNGEITSGIIRSVGMRKLPVKEGSRMVTREVECAIFQLSGGVKAFCPINEYSDHEYQSLTGFVGTIQEFTIQEINLENQIAIVSVKEADEIRRTFFFDKIVDLEKREKLEEAEFDGTVTGYNAKTNWIYVKVEGSTCFMHPNDWDHEKTNNIQEEATRNLKIKVKVLRFRIEGDTNQIQVSRKAATRDPFLALLEQKEDDAVVGRITNVHPLHGIFVQLDSGVIVKATKPRSLAAPIADDIVQCRIDKVDVKERKARVVIIGYPQGKKKRADAGAFLYQ